MTVSYRAIGTARRSSSSGRSMTLRGTNLARPPTQANGLQNTKTLRPPKYSRNVSVRTTPTFPSIT